MNAAKASIAAQSQGKFWEMHDKIFDNIKALADGKYEEWAKELGLDVAKFKADFADAKTAAIVKQDMDEARRAGLRGTPSFYINGRRYQGGMSPAALKQVMLKNFPKK